jgi:hypothetical protein
VESEVRDLAQQVPALSSICHLLAKELFTNVRHHKDLVDQQILLSPAPFSTASAFRLHNMAEKNSITRITTALAKVTLSDGAVPTKIFLANNIRPKAAVTSLTTMLEVVWYKPHRHIWLQYNTQEKAEAALWALQGREIAGVRFRCDMKETHTRPTIPFSVRLQGMPESVGLADITPLLHGSQSPDGIVYGSISHSENGNALQQICDRICARTSDQIKESRTIEVKNGIKQKAEVTLRAEAANLAAHAKALNGITIPEIGHGKVYFVERLRLYVAIESDFYKRRSKTLKGIAGRAWKTHHIEVKVFGELRSAQNTFLILITGNGRDAIQKVKAEIDGCIAADAIKGLQRREGLPEGRGRIYLHTAREYILATNEGGLDRLRGFYGDTCVSLDKDANPPVITVTAQDDKLGKANELLFQKIPEGSDVGECSICGEENVKLLKAPICDHSSCEVCLNNYCLLNTLNAAVSVPLKCFTDLECTQVFPIHWLERNLSPVAYRSLFERVIASRCQQDPEHFGRCAGVDCDEHLAISKRANKSICPRCLTVNCTTCKIQYHFGETCNESQRRRDPQNAALGQYLTEIGGKLCPRCATPGVRTEGCMHIECPGCSVHYCWHCLASFPTSREVYAHMTAAHGGAFADMIHDMDRLEMGDLMLLDPEDGW